MLPVRVSLNEGCRQKFYELTMKEEKIVAQRAIKSEVLADSVKQKIQDMILLGELNPGDKLPSEIEFAQEMGISRVTLREATAQLERDGLISRQNGVGSFITLPKPFLSGQLEVGFSLSSAASAAGLPVETCGVNVRQRRPLQEEIKALQLKDGEEVTECRRMRKVAKRPIVMSIDVIPANILSVQRLREVGCQSLYRILEEQCRCSVDSSEANLFAVLADRRRAELLEIGENEPLLLIVQTDYDAKKRPLLYSREYYVSSRIGFKLNRQRSLEQYALEYIENENSKESTD